MEINMRSPSVVFREIYDIIPEEYWDKSSSLSKQDFNWYIEDASYKAPEQWPDVYSRFQVFLSKLFKRGWEKNLEENLFIVKAWSIFSKVPEQEIIDDIKKLL